MNEITRILSTLDEGDPLESDRLLPLCTRRLRPSIFPREMRSRVWAYARSFL